MRFSRWRALAAVLAVSACSKAPDTAANGNQSAPDTSAPTAGSSSQRTPPAALVLAGIPNPVDTTSASDMKAVLDALIAAAPADNAFLEDKGDENLDIGNKTRGRIVPHEGSYVGAAQHGKVLARIWVETNKFKASKGWQKDSWTYWVMVKANGNGPDDWTALFVNPTAKTVKATVMTKYPGVTHTDAQAHWRIKGVKLATYTAGWTTCDGSDCCCEGSGCDGKGGGGGGGPRDSLPPDDTSHHH